MILLCNEFLYIQSLIKERRQKQLTKNMENVLTFFSIVSIEWLYFLTRWPINYIYDACIFSVRKKCKFTVTTQRAELTV